MSPEETVNEFIARVLRLDLDAACELVSDDVEYDNVPIGKVTGPDGIKGILGGMVGAIDEVDWIIHRQVAAGPIVMNERTDKFRIGEAWVAIPVAGVFEVDGDGRITLWRDYFDMNTFNTQLADLAG